MKNICTTIVVFLGLQTLYAQNTLRLIDADRRTQPKVICTNKAQGSNLVAQNGLNSQQMEIRNQQRQTIRSNYIQLQNLEISRQRQELNRQRQLARVAYEKSVIRYPENDFKSDLHTYKINVKLKQEKYKVQFIHSTNWVSKKKHTDDLYFTDFRNYADGTNMLFSAFYPTTSNEKLNKETIRSIPQLMPSYSFGLSCNENLEVAFLNMQYPAEESGLEIGDKILSINNTEISSPKQLNQELASYTQKDSVQFAIQRGDAVYQLKMSPLPTLSKYSGDIKVAGYSGFYWLTEKEKHVFGKNERTIQVNTAVFVDDQIFQFVHIFTGKEDPKLLEFDFQRYRKMMLIQLRNIKIKKY